MSGLRRLLIAILACCIAGLTAVLAGPLSSGAMLLLLAGDRAPMEHDLPDSYEARHKGHIDLSTGHYVREDEDLVVRGTPALILRRAYLSEYRVSKEFGVGAMNGGEWYLIGDSARFQSASLIRGTDSRVDFTRISPGTSFWNAMYEHQGTVGDWQGARLGWTGTNWALRKRDSTLAVFQGCGSVGSCSILEARDADGHVVTYRRDDRGRLARMEAGRRWIAFDYDSMNRITRAYDSTPHEVRYEYDAAGRLSRVVGHDGAVRRYTYTPRDQMATIVEPGTDIENIYDAAGLCIRQVNGFPDNEAAEPYIFDFTYRIENRAVVQTDTKRSDGTWTTYAFKDRYVTAEAWGGGSLQAASFTYERDAATNAIAALTLTCPDRTGRPLRHSSIVRDGNEEWIKEDLVRTHCSWRRALAPMPAPSTMEPR
jgi:YD repeat-containing protein